MKKIIEKLVIKPSISSKGKTALAFFWGSLLHWGIIPSVLIIIFRRIDHYLPSLSILTPFNYILAAGAFFLGIIWTLASILDQWNIGKGTFIPVSSPTKKLVVEGCYRYSRNPMYIGYLFLFAGAGLAFNSIGIILGLLPLIVLFLLVYAYFVEEKVLLMKFGDEYREYKEKTPFLFPIPMESLGWNIPSSIRFILFLLLVIGLSISIFISYNAFSVKSQRFGEIIWHGPRNKMVVALTFDDGPNSPYTDEILNILKKYNVKATFFLVGFHVDQYPDIVKKIVKEGHSIGNHTYTHSTLVFDNGKRIEEEISKTENSIINASGIKPSIIRFPKDWRKPEVCQIAEEKGYTIISFSKRSFDWTNPGVDKIVKRVTKNIKPGDIIEMHDGDGDNLVYQHSRQQTVESLPLIIEELKKEGYSFVTIPELLSYEYFD